MSSRNIYKGEDRRSEIDGYLGGKASAARDSGGYHGGDHALTSAATRCGGYHGGREK